MQTAELHFLISSCISPALLPKKTSRSSSRIDVVCLVLQKLARVLCYPAEPKEAAYLFFSQDTNPEMNRSCMPRDALDGCFPAFNILTSRCNPFLFISLNNFHGFQLYIKNGGQQGCRATSMQNLGNGPRELTRSLSTVLGATYCWCPELLDLQLRTAVNKGLSHLAQGWTTWLGYVQ